MSKTQSNGPTAEDGWIRLRLRIDSRSLLGRHIARFSDPRYALLYLAEIGMRSQENTAGREEQTPAKQAGDDSLADSNMPSSRKLADKLPSLSEQKPSANAVPTVDSHRAAIGTGADLERTIESVASVIVGETRADSQISALAKSGVGDTGTPAATAPKAGPLKMPSSTLSALLMMPVSATGS